MPEQAVALLNLSAHHEIGQNIGIFRIAGQFEGPTQYRSAHEHILGAEIRVAGFGSAALAARFKPVCRLNDQVVIARFTGSVS